MHTKEPLSFEDLTRIYLSKLERNNEETLKIPNLYFVDGVTSFGKYLDESPKEGGGVMFCDTKTLSIHTANFLNHRHSEFKFKGKEECIELFDCGVNGFVEWLGMQYKKPAGDESRELHG